MRPFFFLTGMVASLPVGVMGQSNSGSYRFLDIPTSAFVAGLGGVNVSRNDRDINLITSNPSLVGDSLNMYLSLNYLLYPGDIKTSNLTYTTDIGNTGSWTFNLVYFDYGEIDSYDNTGSDMGSFSANEYAIAVGKTHQIDNYRVGANLRFAHSAIVGFNSSALFLDLGGSFIHPDRDFTVGMAIKNLGIVLDDYSETADTRLPLDVQVGTSFKPIHMPFRFSFTAYRLTDWSAIENEGTTGYANPSAVDNIFRHVIVGTEVLLGKNVVALLGYNHRRRREMKLESGGGAGFSYGLLVRVRELELGYSRASYHIGGSSNTFTLTMDTRKLLSKKRIIE